MTLPRKIAMALKLFFNMNNMNLSEVDKSISTTKRIYQNFGFGDLRSGQCCDLTIIRQGKNVLMLFTPKVTTRNVLFISIYSNVYLLGHSQWPICSFDPMISHSGHSMSNEVKLV